MKNTMKKLLSLVLVAMLLVSAIPFQAAASSTDSKTVPVKVYIDGVLSSTQKTLTLNPGESVTLTQELAESMINKDKSFVKWTNMDDKETSGTIRYEKITDGYFVNLYVETKGAEPEEDTRVAKKVPVKIYVNNTYVRDGEITVPVDGSVTLTKELGESLVRTDKVFVKWTGASDNEATDVSIKYSKITDDYYVKLFVKTNSSEPETVEPITVKIVDANGKAIAKEFQLTPVKNEKSVVGDILTYRWMGNWKDSYEFVTAKSDDQGSGLTLSSVIDAGDTLTITLKAKSSGSNSSDSDKDSDTHTVAFYDYYGGFVFEVEVEDGKKISTDDLKTAQKKVGTVDGRVFGGWQIDDEGTVYSNSEIAKRSIKHDYDLYAYFTTPSNKFPYGVNLWIYKDTKVGSPDKKVVITNGIAKDGRVTLEEVKDVVEQYYTAKTSRGISYDGLYLAQGNWVADYVADTNKYDKIEASEMVQNGELNIIVMIGNANAKSGEKADSSNPKTGDMIFVPVIFMLVSGAAIAGVCIYNKKRSAR